MASQPAAARAVFDAYRSTYETVVQDSIAFSGLKHERFVQAKVALIDELFRIHFGEARPALLDVGCGVGVMHDLLRPLVTTLSGADLSAGALERARSDHPGIDYRVQGSDRLPWPDDAFDAILAVCVLHHVPPSERDALLREMRRVVRPGGLTIVIEHNPWNPLTRLAVARCSFDHDAVLLDAREGRALLSRNGFDVVESRHFLLSPWRDFVSRTAELGLRSLPLGAQYAATGRKPPTPRPA